MATKNLQYESGRSMVEMLGTLAIIGVLSIGGIAGYKYGMDKYRANQTVNDIMLRAVDLMMQASQGHEALSLSEWDKENSIYDFSAPAYSADDENLIMFDVGANDKIPQRVCEMVFDGLANTAVQIDINAERANSSDTCGQDNTITFYFGGGSTEATDAGTTEEKCGDTVCGTCQKCKNETCVTVSDYEAKCTTDDNKTGWCVNGICQAETCNCGEGQYCEDSNTRCDSPTPNGNCVDLDFRTVDIDDTIYYISNQSISWWNAASFCEALGKKMINHNELIQVCNSDGIGCCNTAFQLSSVGKALYEKGWGSSDYAYIWSSVLYNSCNSYGVGFDNVYGCVVDDGGYRTFTGDKRVPTIAVCR